MPHRLHNRKAAPGTSHSDEAWSAARRLARELDRILDGSGPRRAAINRAAAELRLSTRQ
ncbi:transposase, partial [Mesorhizobium sp. M2A.F.Ca.ET.039.01.1.1]